MFVEKRPEPCQHIGRAVGGSIKIGHHNHVNVRAAPTLRPDGGSTPVAALEEIADEDRGQIEILAQPLPQGSVAGDGIVPLMLGWADSVEEAFEVGWKFHRTPFWDADAGG